MPITFKTFKKAVVVTLSAIAIDYIFHLRYTTPMEVNSYFTMKLFLGILIGMKLFETKVSMRNIAIAAGIFTFGISVYYRLFELLFGLDIGARVPTIRLFGKTVPWKTKKALSTLIWAALHFGAFFVPAVLVGRLSK